MSISSSDSLRYNQMMKSFGQMLLALIACAITMSCVVHKSVPFSIHRRGHHLDKVSRLKEDASLQKRQISSEVALDNWKLKQLFESSSNPTRTTTSTSTSSSSSSSRLVEELKHKNTISSKSKKRLLRNDDDLIETCPNLQYVQQGMDMEGADAGDRLGWSVSLSADGQVLAIGAPEDTSSVQPANSTGYVRVFRRDNTSSLGWLQIGNNLDGEAFEDSFGWSVALSDNGEMLAISARISSNGKWTGHARIFEMDLSSKLGWTQVGQIMNGANVYKNSGTKISMSGDGSMFAIGADEIADGGEAESTNNGVVTVYQRDTSNLAGWSKVGQDIGIKTTRDSAGGSLSLSKNGKVLAVGSSHLSLDGKTNIGHVRMFERDPSIDFGWKQVWQYLGTEEEKETTIKSVATSKDGNVVAIGTFWNLESSDDAGHVRVYHRYDARWLEVGDIYGEAGGDNSGHSVSLSDDGNILAIGAWGNDGRGNNSGHARVYRRDEKSSSGFVQMGSDLDGKMKDSNAGWSVSLSADGSSLAVGAPSAGWRDRAGYVKIYDIPCDISSLVTGTDVSRLFQIEFGLSIYFIMKYTLEYFNPYWIRLHGEGCDFD